MTRTIFQRQANAKGESNARAVELASRLRNVMEKHAESVRQIDGVTGAGVAWRDGTLKFVIETDSFASIESLSHSLPAAVQGFPALIEVVSGDDRFAFAACGEVDEAIEAGSDEPMSSRVNRCPESLLRLARLVYSK